MLLVVGVWSIHEVERTVVNLDVELALCIDTHRALALVEIAVRGKAGIGWAVDPNGDRVQHIRVVARRTLQRFLEK